MFVDLRGVGRHPAKLATELQAGDVIVYQNGYKALIMKVQKVTPKSTRVFTAGAAGKIYDHNYKDITKVAVVRKEELLKRSAAYIVEEGRKYASDGSWMMCADDLTHIMPASMVKVCKEDLEQEIKTHDGVVEVEIIGHSIEVVYGDLSRKDSVLEKLASAKDAPPAAKREITKDLEAVPTR